MGKRRRSGGPLEQASPGIISYLLTGQIDYAQADALAVFDMDDPDHRSRVAARWRELRDDLMPAFVRDHPGRRPAAWWTIEAPRDPAYVGTRDEVCSPELRQRVGGSGRPSRETYPAVFIDFGAFGIPHCWQDVHPDDPPMVESEASYLRRHNLLEPGEAKRLGPGAFDAVPAIVDDEDAIQLHLPEAAEGATPEEYREQLAATIRRAPVDNGEDE